MKPNIYLTLSIITLFFLLSCGALSHTDCKDCIVWKKHDQLRWKHFKTVKSIKDTADIVARINLGIGYVINEYPNRFKINIFAYFNPKKSLVIENYMSDYILNHEQVHLNIEELNVRKLRKLIIESDPKNWNFRYFDRLYDSIAKVNKNMQDLYDKEAGYISDSLQQNRWDNDILEQLNLLEDYKSRIIKIYKKRDKKLLVYNIKKYFR